MKEIKKGLVEPVSQLEGFDAFINQISAGNNGKIVGTIDACKAHMMYALSYYANKTGVIITIDEVTGKKLYDDMSALYGEDNVVLYPARDILFYNADVHSMDITAKRMQIIEDVLNEKTKLVIIPSEALLNPLSNRQTWQSYRKLIRIADQLDPRGLSKYLVDIGYTRVAKVESIGQFAIRGGIIDIYTPSNVEPYRIELWDDEVDSIRTFNPTTQRSIDKIEQVMIIPNQEMIFPIRLLQDVVPTIQNELKHVKDILKQDKKWQSIERLEEQVKEDIAQISEGINGKNLETYVPYTALQTVTILDYLPKDTLLYIDEPSKVKARCERLYNEYLSSMKDRLEHGHTLPTQMKLIFDYEDVAKTITDYQHVEVMNFGGESYIDQNVLEVRVFENTTFYNNMDLLEKDIKEWKKQKKKIVILSGTKSKAKQLVEEFEYRDVICNYSEKLEEPILPGQVVLTKGVLGKGFSYESIDFCVISDKDLFGKDKKKQAKKKKYKGSKIDSFLDLSPGDYVVHENHGVGVFKGVEQIVIDHISRDNLKIEYADESILYVNINQMDLVQKYVGSEGRAPKLNKLGNPEWKKSKTKAQKAVKDIAKDLIKLYSKRQHSRGFAYEEDSIWQKEFEDLFPYAETSDQLEAIEDVKKDMQSDKIMDRLVCGDVGYGKTEVAIRGAFKAVQNSKQVAYLVPTTILAQQHFQRFEERMQNYPIKVGILSRFRTPKQIKQTLDDIRRGTVDIVIGTHRLLSKDVIFKDLGLLIIDEEQRFGVTHKEKLKQMRTEVDVLTLTATPIPRTLHMSLIGVRDMSVLEEAPLERRAVQTYVIEYSEDFVKDAIHRELGRQGQVYFLYNKVNDIEEKALAIQKLVPDANVAFAHGQMSERELEKIMLAFIEHKIDVLVCTTIIETGLDISNANTIIINDADRMGLSQLYQLRGRVGRSNKAAYAYLMYKKDKVLKEVAEKRLQAIKQFTELGAGFKIAMRDLEIRGAGNLLGAQQHGQMEAIGYDLYCKMLKEAISLEQGEEVAPSIETTIEMKINAYIPDSYINDEVEKLDVYKKIASITSEKDYYDIQEELEDRYGTIPTYAINLLEIANIKWMANEVGVTVISDQGNVVTFTFSGSVSFDMQKLGQLIATSNRRLNIVAGKQTMLKAVVDAQNKKTILTYIKSILQQLNELKVKSV